MMTSSETRPWVSFLEGVRDGLPVALASAPFGLLFGALAIKTGLTFNETILMSASIYAGASQMVGIELFGKTIAPWLVILSIFAVNFRHVLYSASIARHIEAWPPLTKVIGFFFLVDPQYAASEQRAERGLPVSPGWYFGMAAVIYLLWIVDAVLGALFGSLIENPRALGLDFLLPIYFLGLVVGFRSRPLWLPIVLVSAVVSIIAYNFVGSPWHVSIGAAAGIALAAAFPPAREPDGKAS